MPADRQSLALEVTVTQTDTGVTRTAETDASGVYSLPSLPLGPYRMEVKKEGFSTYVQSGIVLQVDTAPTIDPVMKVGAITESVQVEAAAAMVETHSTGVGQVVNSQDVVELPLNGREITQLITLAGGSNTVQYGYGQAPSSGNLDFQQELSERGAGQRGGRDAEWNHLPAGRRNA